MTNKLVTNWFSRWCFVAVVDVYLEQTESWQLTLHFLYHRHSPVAIATTACNSTLPRRVRATRALDAVAPREQPHQLTRLRAVITVVDFRVSLEGHGLSGHSHVTCKKT